MSCLKKCFIPGWSPGEKPLPVLIEKRKWSAVEHRLQTDFFEKNVVNGNGNINGNINANNNANNNTNANTNAKTNDDDLENTDTEGCIHENNETILHTACRYQPPLEIIELIVRSCPQSISTMTKREHYLPLHLAAAYGAHPDVISFIADRYPDGACCSDYQGRTPLHLVCQNYPEHYKEERTSNGEEAILMEDAMLRTVRALTRKCPSMVNANDDEGMTALEHAICGNIHLEIVQSIQRASERFLKAEREKSKQGSLTSIKSTDETSPSKKSDNGTKMDIKIQNNSPVSLKSRSIDDSQSKSNSKSTSTAITKPSIEMEINGNRDAKKETRDEKVEVSGNHSEVSGDRSEVSDDLVEVSYGKNDTSDDKHTLPLVMDANNNASTDVDATSNE